MKLNNFIFVLALFCLSHFLSSAQDSFAQENKKGVNSTVSPGNFTVPLGVYNESFFDTSYGTDYEFSILQFGTDQFATSCIDASLNENILPPKPPSGVFDARFSLPCDWGYEDSRVDVRSYISPAQTDTFILYCQKDGANLPVTFVWPDLTGLYSGDVRLKDRLTGTIFNLDMKSQTSVAIASSAILQYLMIIAEGPIGGQTPVLYIPPPNAATISLYNDSAMFHWKRKPFERRYHFQLSEDELFTTNVYEDTSFNGNFKKYGPLTDNTQYYARIRAITQVGLTDWGPTSTFVATIDSFNISIKNTWNIVSVASLTEDTAPTTLFPSATTGAYGYTPTGYETVTDMNTGSGYWMRFDGNQVQSMYGFPVLGMGIPVTQGWNLVGTISEPLPVSSITTAGVFLLSPFFQYDAGYVAVDTLFPGHGYWIKADKSGTLGFNTNTLSAKNSTASNNFEKFNRIIIEDSYGRRQVLYFSADNNHWANTPGYFDLPPAPPQGAFDARFETGTMVEFVEHREMKSISILISSAKYPVTIRWDNENKRQVNSALIVNNKEIPMPGSGSYELRTRSSIGVRLSDVSSDKILPSAFALMQNYPNPFNPETHLQFSIANLQFVSLKVYDVLGREVATLVNEQKAPGTYSISWNADGVPSGVYFYKITSGTYSETKKMILIR